MKKTYILFFIFIFSLFLAACSSFNANVVPAAKILTSEKEALQKLGLAVNAVTKSNNSSLVDSTIQSIKLKQLSNYEWQDYTTSFFDADLRYDYVAKYRLINQSSLYDVEEEVFSTTNVYEKDVLKILSYVHQNNHTKYEFGTDYLKTIFDITGLSSVVFKDWQDFEIFFNVTINIQKNQPSPIFNQEDRLVYPDASWTINYNIAFNFYYQNVAYSGIFEASLTEAATNLPEFNAKIFREGSQIGTIKITQNGDCVIFDNNGNVLE
ncbi:MAG: hypothetical protein WC860_01540 [Candidatus Margulisiibacteriota bacterium]|jgi:hypothetical protein